MGDIPIERSRKETIPEDGRITLGEEYSKRRVPIQIDGVTDEKVEVEGHKVDDVDPELAVRYFNCDERGRFTVPADIREMYDEIRYFVSEAAVEEGGIGEVLRQEYGEEVFNESITEEA